MPRTIEAATRRYLDHYERNFIGSAADMYRLSKLAESFISKLRKAAPIFYEEKLPTLVNQAASQLLTYDVQDPAQQQEFHKTHAYFLLVLQSLRETQPAGEVSFSTEKYRFEERAKLIQRQSELDKEIDELEASELDFDDVGEDELEVMFDKIDKLKAEQNDVNLKLAILEGENVVEKPTFELRIKKNSILNKLTEKQLKDLEKRMFDFYVENEKTTILVNKAHIDDMIEKLGIEKGKFQLEELRHMAKDALDAYKTYFREKEQKWRDEYYNMILENDRLKPKEGLILDNPDCIPEHVKRILEANHKRGQEEIENLLDQYTVKGDIIGDELGESVSSDEEEKVTSIDAHSQAMEALRKRGLHHKRVKEEPRDDYTNEAEDQVGSTSAGFNE